MKATKQLKKELGSDVCPACNDPWITHKGIIPTCHQNQIALQCLEKIASIGKNTLSKRLVVATLSLLKHCK